MLPSFTQAVTDETHAALRPLRKNLRARYKDASPLLHVLPLCIDITTGPNGFSHRLGAVEERVESSHRRIRATPPTARCPLPGSVFGLIKKNLPCVPQSWRRRLRVNFSRQPQT